MIGLLYIFLQLPLINLVDVPLEYYEPPMETPVYLESYVENGVKKTRVSDSDVFGDVGARLGHNYSTDQAWNVTEDKIKLAGYPCAILDAQTYEFLQWANIPSYGRWSNVQPNIIYGTRQNRLVAFNIDNGTDTVLKEFSTNADFTGKGNQDLNDRYFGLVSSSELIVWDSWLDITYTTPRLSGLNWFSVSPLGEYCIASYTSDGDGLNNGLVRYDITLENPFKLSYYSGHGCFAKNNDKEVYVQFGNSPQWQTGHSLEMIILETGESISKFYWNNQNTTGIWGGHISATYDRENFVYISEGCCLEHTTLPSEIFAYDLNSNSIERFGKSNSSHSYYDIQAKVSVNRTGDKVIFTTDWMQGEHFAMVYEVDNTLGIDYQNEVEIDKPYKKTYYNILGQEVKKLDKGNIYIEISYYIDKVKVKKIIL